MAEYLSPGVYVEEKSSGVKPIEGVGTSTGAFVGIAEKGPVGEANLIANWTQFVNKYGAFNDKAYLAYAVYQFFAEGGTRCYVVRTCHYTDITNKSSKTTKAATATLNDSATSPAASLKFTALEEGTWGEKITIEAKDATDTTLTSGFKLVVNYDEDEQETFDNLTMGNVLDEVKSSAYIKVEKVGTTAPKKGTSVTLRGGSNGAAARSTGNLTDSSNPAVGSLKFTALNDGAWGDKISIEAKSATDTALANGFKLVVKFEGIEQESFDNLTMENVLEKVKSSAYVKVEKIGSTPNAPKKDTSVTLKDASTNASSLTVADFEGDAKAGNGLHAFDVVDDINIVAMPDSANILTAATNKFGPRNAIIKGYNYCQNRGDCFFIADSPRELSPTQVKDFKEAKGDYNQQNPFNSSFAALYYPWVYISDPLGGTKLVPPSGAVAGTYAHTDSVRGVHKAPAGTSEGYLDSVSGIERIITKSEHDTLNQPGINVIRSFPTAGICIWGARTLSADPEWKYINIRRLFLFLEESLDKATQWVVFEPNSPALWGSIIRNITAFLLRVWRDGALYGATPEEAFFVKVDEENNPEEVRNVGQLVIEVGVAPVRPAEFVIIRIKQKTQSK